MLIFQIKRIISSEKWFNYVVTFFFCFENGTNLGGSDDAKRRKKRGWSYNITVFVLTFRLPKERRNKTVYYIHTEKYSPKSYAVNFRTQISSSQSEERTMVFTREKWYVQSESRKMFFHVLEKWYVQSEATEVCEFRTKIPTFYCSFQRRFAHIQREKFYSKSFSR